MDGEHAFSAAIILVMINIAFPYNARDRAAMDMALNLLDGIAEKGNSLIKSLYQLLVNLHPITRSQNLDESMLQRYAPVPVPDPAATYIPLDQCYDVNPGVFSAVDGNFFEGGGTGDERIWEEGFEFFDINMELDWTQWNY